VCGGMGGGGERGNATDQCVYARCKQVLKMAKCGGWRGEFMRSSKPQ
jgi:hypothetical protein